MKNSCKNLYSVTWGLNLSNNLRIKIMGAIANDLGEEKDFFILNSVFQA